MAETTIKITGLKEVQKSLYSYSQQLGDRVVKGSLRQGANLVKKSVQAYAPVQTGKLKRIGIRVGNSKFHRGKSSKDLIGAFLTISRRKKDGTYYGWFQERGWNPRGKMNPLRYSSKIKGYTHRATDSSRKTQRGNTDVPGKHFVERAFLEKKEAAVELIRQSAIAAAEVLARKIGL